MTSAVAAEHRHRQEGAGEGNRREEVAGEDHGLRPDDRRRDSADHHPGNRPRPEGGIAAVGGGEAVLLGERAADADDQEARDQARRTGR